MVNSGGEPNSRLVSRTPRRLQRPKAGKKNATSTAHMSTQRSRCQIKKVDVK